MGRQAAKIESTNAPKPSRLRLVGTARTPSSPRNARAQELAARRNFRMFATLMAVVAVLGLSRVWLSVEATRASLESDQLRESIRAERYEGDMLEVRESALGSPSRILTIAGKAMGMAPAASISYLDLTDEPTQRPAAHAATIGQTEEGLKRTLSNVLDLTAGEAQVLLVGDVGLASTR